MQNWAAAAAAALFVFKANKKRPRITSRAFWFLVIVNYHSTPIRMEMPEGLISLFSWI